MSEVYGNVKHHAGASQAAQSSARLGQPEGRAGSPRGVLNERRCTDDAAGDVASQCADRAQPCAAVQAWTRVHGCSRLQGRVCTRAGCSDEEECGFRARRRRVESGAGWRWTGRVGRQTDDRARLFVRFRCPTRGRPVPSETDPPGRRGREGGTGAARAGDGRTAAPAG